MSARFALLFSMLIVAAAGCGTSENSASSSAQRSPIRLPSDQLTTADLDRFLAVIEARGESAIPEFSPPDDDETFDHRLTAGELTNQFRRQFRSLFDVERQSALWNDDEQWSRAFERQHISSVEFAGLVRSVSCAVMCVRLKARVDIDRLLENARAEVDDISSTMDAIDDLASADRTKQDEFIRSQSALRLARSVALLEFAEMIRQVPESNCGLVRKYSTQLKPLLPAAATDGLLSELQALGTSRATPVRQAKYEEEGARRLGR